MAFGQQHDEILVLVRLLEHEETQEAEVTSGLKRY